MKYERRNPSRTGLWIKRGHVALHILEDENIGVEHSPVLMYPMKHLNGRPTETIVFTSGRCADTSNIIRNVPRIDFLEYEGGRNLRGRRQYPLLG